MRNGQPTVEQHIGEIDPAAEGENRSRQSFERFMQSL